MSTKLITEILSDINKDPVSITNYKKQAILSYLFGFAFRPEGKFLLPEGTPPYKEDAAPLGMSAGNLTKEIKKLYIFCRTDLKSARREQLFIQMLEAIHPDEAKLLLAIKDQNITRLYPNITHKLVYESGFIPNPPPSVEINEVKKEQSRGRGRPRKN